MKATLSHVPMQAESATAQPPELDAREAELLSRTRRTATDGWVVQLTEAPLDLDIPAHLDALLRT
jgi:hypothetical protein